MCSILVSANVNDYYGTRDGGGPHLLRQLNPPSMTLILGRIGLWTRVGCMGFLSQLVMAFKAY